MDSHRLIPSMFHRRLFLLGSIVLVVAAMLSAQAVRLTVLEGADRRAEAESKLDRRVYLPTYRGRILDRHGRVLAEDRPSYDIAVSYAVIAGTWALDRAAGQARRELGSAVWNTMGPDQRDEVIDRHLPRWKARTDELWSAIEALGQIDADELAERRNRILARLQLRSAIVWENQRQAWLRRFGTSSDAAEEVSGFRPRPLLEHKQPHVVLSGVSDTIAFEFQRMAIEHEGIVHVLPSHKRDQPWATGEVLLDRGPTLPSPLQHTSPIAIRVEGVADHIIGTMRAQVNAEDMKRRPFTEPETGKVDLGGYQLGDTAGSRGLEAAFEDHLRGLRGVINERRHTGEQERTEPTPGRDLRTTLDIRLQMRVQAILSHEYGLTRVQPWHHNHPSLPTGRPLNASAVVLDVDTGEILAMVSMPTMSMGKRMSEARRAIDDPWVNRPAEGIYPPGSIIKPLVLCAAVAEGLHTIDTPIECRGHYYEHIKTVARCWIYRERYGLQSHGPLRAEEALARSCNIYFYTLAGRLGMQRLASWYRRFGLGSLLDIGLRSPSGPGESAGDVPGEQEIAKLRQRGEFDFASVIMGIGQGPVTWTPVQAANAYATLARGGIVRDATLVPDSMRPEPRASREHLALSPTLVNAALEGLRQSVSEPHGTGWRIRYDAETGRAPDRIINVEGVTVWAKTGTAEAPGLPVDTDGDHEPDAALADLSHAWFVGVVGPSTMQQPTHAIAVLVEYGGSGGRVAGPIANQIIRALQSEGYLPGGEGQSDVRSIVEAGE